MEEIWGWAELENKGPESQNHVTGSGGISGSAEDLRNNAQESGLSPAPGRGQDRGLSRLRPSWAGRCAFLPEGQEASGSLAFLGKGLESGCHSGPSF